MLIEFKSVIKKFGNFTAVTGISIQIEKSEIFGFLGPNGAGKTSMMRMLYGSSPISSGHIRVGNLEYPKDQRAIKSILGVISQDNNLDQEITVKNNLVIHALHHRIKRREAETKAVELLRFVQLQDRANSDVRSLSGGMKRRLMIARGLINSPKILILDEPTTGLDPQSRHLLWDKMRELKRTGITQLLTTHYMDEAEQLCDRLAIIDKGRIIALGEPKHLIYEHVGRDVVEVSATKKIRQDIGKTFKKYLTHTDHLADYSLFYTKDRKPFIDVIQKTHDSITKMSFRQATLEDVFLKLTGRQLRD